MNTDRVDWGSTRDHPGGSDSGDDDDLGEGPDVIESGPWVRTVVQMIAHVRLCQQVAALVHILAFVLRVDD